MQTPSSKTTVFRCIALGDYLQRMLSKFPNDKTLTDLAKKAGAATDNLAVANTSYESSKRDILRARVDVRFMDFYGDNEIGHLLRRAVIADDRENGPIFTLLAPEGKNPLVKPFGQKQVSVLIDLEGRLDAAVKLWGDAPTEKAKIQQIRVDYQAALTARDAAWQTARNLRVLRNLARDQFVDAYRDIALEVKQLFPRDTRSQEIFFDSVDKDENEPENENESGPTGATGATGATAATGPTGPGGG